LHLKNRIKNPGFMSESKVRVKGPPPEDLRMVNDSYSALGGPALGFQ
jgi:hypothetical protein